MCSEFHRRQVGIRPRASYLSDYRSPLDMFQRSAVSRLRYNPVARCKSEIAAFPSDPERWHRIRKIKTEVMNYKIF